MERSFQELPHSSRHLNHQRQESIESSFTRLSLSSGLPLYPVSGENFFRGALQDNYLCDLSWSVPELRQNLHYSMPPSSFEHTTRSNIDLLDVAFNEPKINRSGVQRTHSRGFSHRESNPGLMGGLMDGLVPKNHDLIGSSPHNKRTHWLQESWNFLCVRDLKGKIVTFAKDRYGCRLLQDVMKSVTQEEITMVFLELIDHVCELMIDPCGNYVVQRLVEICSEEQRTQILLRLTKHQLLSICLNAYGTRAIRTLLYHINTPHQIKIFMSAIIPVAVALCKDGNGQHVIVHCSKHFSAEDNKYLLNEIAGNCFGIATNKSGCCVLQQCVDNAQGESRDRLVAEIITNAMLLAEDPYGNYVVQHMLEYEVPQITANLLAQLEGSYTALSCNKYGSNVVEKCLTLTREDLSMQIVKELVNSPDADMLLVHPYGNYVIQSALKVSKQHQGPLYNALLKLIQANLPMMRSNIYGKKVLDWFSKRKQQYV